MIPPSFLTGLMLCASLIVAIGAQNAFVLRQGLRREHVMAIVLFCCLSDLLFISAGVAGVAAFLTRLPTASRLLSMVGAVFLCGYGIYALRRAARVLTPVFARARAWQLLDSAIALIMFALAARLTRQALQG